MQVLAALLVIVLVFFSAVDAKRFSTVESVISPDDIGPDDIGLVIGPKSMSEADLIKLSSADLMKGPCNRDGAQLKCCFAKEKHDPYTCKEDCSKFFSRSTRKEVPQICCARGARCGPYKAEQLMNALRKKEKEEKEATAKLVAKVAQIIADETKTRKEKTNALYKALDRAGLALNTDVLKAKIKEELKKLEDMLPDGWVVQHDPVKSLTWYKNEELSVSQWDWPTVDLDTKSREALTKEIFIYLDEDRDNYLSATEMRPFAKLTGFRGGNADFFLKFVNGVSYTHDNGVQLSTYVPDNELTDIYGKVVPLTNMVESAVKFKPDWSVVKEFLQVQNIRWKTKRPEPLVTIDAKPNDMVFVIGDLHGELVQLHYVMRRITKLVRDSGRTLQFSSTLTRTKSELLLCMPGVYYVFLGDYVDRAPDAISDLKTALLLLLYRSLCPMQTYGDRGVLLLRGNHEDVSINNAYGFLENLQKLYPDAKQASKDLFAEAWSTLPVAAAVNKKVLLMHGGLSRDVSPFVTPYSGRFDDFVRDFNKMKMPEASCGRQHPPLCDVMWSDPRADFGESANSTANRWQSSPRGAGWLFGSDVTTEFMSSTGIELILRGHEVEVHGYSQQLSNVFTIFTAANYCGSMGNVGAFANMRIPEAGHEKTGASAFKLKMELHKNENGKVESAGTKTHKEWSSLMQQRQLVVSALHFASGQRNVLTNQPMKSFTPDGKLAKGSEKPDWGHCEALLAGMQDETQKEVSKILHSQELSHAHGSDELGTILKIKVDELGEAFPLIEDRAERTKRLCEAIMAGTMVEQALKKSGVINPKDDEVLQKEVATRKRQLADETKG